MNRNRARGAGQDRAGFTLIELMIVVTLLGLIGMMLTAVLVRQQRFHRAVASLTDARARMRDVATILPTDLRSMSTIGGDVMVFTDTSIQFRAFTGTAVLCRYDPLNATIIELPPRILAPVEPTNSATTNSPVPAANVLTAWIRPPAPDDIAYIYNEGTEAGNADDDWTPFVIDDTASNTLATSCPVTSTFTTAADATARRYLITLPTAPDQARMKAGSPIRFAREVRYSVYLATDNQWYVGFQRCTPNVVFTSPGDCPVIGREVLAGPVLAGTADTTTSGLFFVYYNQTGGVVTDAAAGPTIAAIGVGVRTTSESLRQAASTKVQSNFAGGDSLRFTIGIRNRI